MCEEKLVQEALDTFLDNGIRKPMRDDTQQSIERICRATEQYGFCTQTFKENMKSPDADIVVLTQITIDRSVDNATQTHSFIGQLLENTTDPSLKSALESCEYSYKILMEALTLTRLRWRFPRRITTP
ncbi:hypothetical protein ACFX13_033995 [Malus domestica]